MGKIKKIMKEYPKLSKALVKVLNGLPFNNKGMRSRSNTIISKGVVCKTAFQIKGKENKIQIDEYAHLKNCRIYINGKNNKIHIHQDAALFHTELYIEDDGGEIDIGAETTICGPTQLAEIEGKKIRIGERCLFSSGINVRTGDSHSILDQQGKRINPSKDVIIADHVWVGNRAIILKGTEIAEDSVVAAAAVVTGKHLQKNTILAGNPARIVKSNISWDENRLPVEGNIM